MTIFNLPDLGEGLPDAEISEWHIKAGDEVKLDQPLVSMETAKAVVEVPSPYDGIITELHGDNGDIIKTGSALISFELAKEENSSDSGTVVGNIKSSGETITDDFIIGGTNNNNSKLVKATPKVKALARKHSIELSTITGSGNNGMITAEDVQQAANPLQEGYEPLKGVRRHMVQTMVQSHAEVVPVAIFDDANIESWDQKQDITVRLIQAITLAAKEEPALNAWYDGHNNAVKVFDKVQLGLATDTADGLFVPVIKNACCLTGSEIRTEINRYKKEVSERTVGAEELTGSTITLSNFGKFAGRYANPIIVPPSVAILGVGRLRQAAVSKNNSVVINPVLPLSLSFDHRAVTGGEATRFLGIILQSLEKATI